jgi:hypothetical protein
MTSPGSGQIGDHPQRRCGSCTACCDGWLQIEVRGHAVSRGKPCPFSTGHDCTIYEERPEDPCQKFKCGWLIARSPLPEWMRPDQAGMILLPAQLRWNELAVDVAVAVGEAPKTKALTWLKQFCETYRRPLLYQVDTVWHAFGPEAFQLEMRAAMARGETIW